MFSALRGFGGRSCEKSSVLEWHTWFKEGHKNVEDNERSGPRSHRTNENIEKARNIMHSDRRLSIRAMAVLLNLDKQWKGPELCPCDWFLYHDNAPAHKVLSVRQFLAQKSITEMENPPFSPYLALNDFWLFPKIMSALKGRRYPKMWQQHWKPFHNRSSKNDLNSCSCSRGVLQRQSLSMICKHIEMLVMK
jgi:hypothetical protein